MSDPSDPAGAYPINRLVRAFEALERKLARDLPPFLVERRPAEKRGKRTPIKAGRLNRRELYRTVYALARTEVELGESPEAIRAGFVEMAEEYKGMKETILKAINDALDGRAPRW